MIEFIKDKLRRWAFKERREELQKKAETLQAKEAELEKRRREIEKEYTDQALRHLVRRKYHGFNPSELIGGQEDVLHDIPEAERLGFLGNLADVIENDSFRKLMEHLYTKQLITTSLESENIDEVNFGRATINGLSIVEESLERYANIYYERSSDESDYDEYSII